MGCTEGVGEVNAGCWLCHVGSSCGCAWVMRACAGDCRDKQATLLARLHTADAPRALINHLVCPCLWRPACTGTCRHVQQVICSSDGKMVRHDLATGDTESVMELRGGEVKCAAFSPPPASAALQAVRRGQPQQLLLASGDQAVRLWDGETFAHRGDLPGGSGRVQVVAFNPDGRQLAAGG